MTDGVERPGVLRADTRGRHFGRDGSVDVVRRRPPGRHTLHETLHRLTAAVREHHGGKPDGDTTVPLAQWRAAHQAELFP